MFRRITVLAGCLWVCLAGWPAAAADPRPAPQLWVGPPGHDNGRCLRELFENPDGWKRTREVVQVLLYADHNLHRQFTDEELKAWFGLLRRWGLRLALEVGAIKPWGLTGEKTFTIQRAKWERFQRLGAQIHAIAMDEPLLCCREHVHKPDDYALEETARFITLVRKHFPDLLIGDIETYPSIPLADHTRWIDALQKRLAEEKVRGLDFYRLDVNWVVFTVRNQGSWLEVKQLEQQCRQRKLPFGLIYWAANYPALSRMGLASDATWYVPVMQQGYDYALIHGAPEHYVLQSWVGAPQRSTPEDDPWTFTRSVLDFSRTFVRPPGK